MDGKCIFILYTLKTFPKANKIKVNGQYSERFAICIYIEDMAGRLGDNHIEEIADSESCRIFRQTMPYCDLIVKN